MPKQNFRQRKTNLSLPTLQLKFLLWMLGACSLVSVYHLLEQHYLLADMTKLGRLRVSPQLIIDFTFAVVLVIYSMSYLFWTNRIFGPLVNIQKTLKEFDDQSCEKTVQKIKLRKNDYFKELADSLNKALNLVDSKEKGFSLIELMICVSIVGILSSIAIPNYNRFKFNTYNSQAKTSLSQLYMLETLFSGEHLTYTTRLDAMGFNATGDMYFDVGFKTDYHLPLTVPQGTDTCINTCDGATCPRSGWRCRETTQGGLSFPFNSFATSTRFQAEAHAHFPESLSIDPDDVAVTFAINQTKMLWNVIPAD